MSELNITIDDSKYDNRQRTESFKYHMEQKGYYVEGCSEIFKIYRKPYRWYSINIIKVVFDNFIIYDKELIEETKNIINLYSSIYNRYDITIKVE